MDYSPPGSSVHGILWARILEWVAFLSPILFISICVYIALRNVFILFIHKKPHMLLRENSQLSSLTQSCPTLCDPMDCSMPGFSVHHQHPPKTCSNSYPLSQWCHPINHPVVPFSSCLQSVQPQGLLQWVTSLHQMAKGLEFQLQHQSFQWIFRTDFL